ncbi:MAG: nickel-dependent hydrogenase large subunit [Bifidobacteriaceae bacterium]|nr:nickel-dependent hydrogenase large subunit [Bifidobacteriaceae bacterium]
MTVRLIIDQAVDGADASVIAERSPEGALLDARLDLSILPRLEPLLLGRPVAEVPPLVERLCGVCPAAHHLAGVAALEALHGIASIPAQARRVRRLLHYGSMLTMHATSFFAAGRQEALALRRLGKLAMAAAGSPGHFPTTAVVGGAAGAMVADAATACAESVAAALAGARDLFRWAQDDPAATAERHAASSDTFLGADVALVDADGRLDPLGERLRAIDPAGQVIVAGALASQWDDLVALAQPEAAASRPSLLAGGADGGHYRVGPVAGLRVAAPTTAVAAELREDWLRGGGGTLAARAVMAVHCVEAIADLVAGQDWIGRDDTEPDKTGPAAAGRVGVGWVDGARGLLVHRYRVDQEGKVDQALVLTPTAQNEYWLSRLLIRALTGDSDHLALENAIREADPCLPCVAAPAGHMGVKINTVTKDR